MRTEFDRLVDELEAAAARLPNRKRSIFLLAYAQRLSKLFGLFEERCVPKSKRFDELLQKTWRATADAAVMEEIFRELESLVPGEEWVVNGFYDAIAQYVGSLAGGALQGLIEGSVQDVPESGVFSCFRLLLTEMRLGCMQTAGNDPEGIEFLAKLHEEPLIVQEAHFWRRLYDEIAGSRLSEEDVHAFAVAHVFDPAKLEPALAEGLARDHVSAKTFLDSLAATKG